VLEALAPGEADPSTSPADGALAEPRRSRAEHDESHGEPW